jgi:hypothetical protein
MTRLAFYRSLLPVVAAGVAYAAGSISGPVAGYVTDSSRTQLRTIFGVPGAFGFSEPLPLPEGVAQIRLAPGQEFALVEQAGGAPAILFLKDGAVDRLAPIEGAMASADWIAFSSSANSALLFSAATNRLQVLSGLPDSPRIVADLDAASLPESPAMGAVSDDGSLVLAASGAAVYRVPSSGPAQVVFSAGGIRSLMVLRNGTDAAISDPSTGSVHIVRNVASHPEAAALASGLDDIGAIYQSSDGQSIFIAQSKTGIASIDLSSGEVKSFPTSVAPAGLIPLRNRDTFLISARPNQPGWIFYRDGAGGRVVFIPASNADTRQIPVKGGVR